MITATEQAIYVLECNNTQNQVTIALKSPDEETFDPLRGPDLIESSVGDIEENMFQYLNSDNKKIQNYFAVSFYFYFIF